MYKIVGVMPTDKHNLVGATVDSISNTFVGYVARMKVTFPNGNCGEVTTSKLEKVTSHAGVLTLTTEHSTYILKSI